MEGFRVDVARQDARGLKWARLAGVCGLTFAFAWLCLMLPRGLERVSPIWLPNAFLLTVLLMSRRSAWPALTGMGALGGLLASLVVGGDPALAVALTLCNTLEAAGCAMLLVRVLGRTPDMSRVGNLIRYAAIVAVSALASAGLATVFLAASGGAPAMSSFATWAMADFAGLVVITPCLLALAGDRSSWRRLVSRDAWPLGLLLLVVGGVFLQDGQPLTYLIVAALLLVTWRLRIAGAAAGLLATLAIAVACTVAGLGPFALIEGSVAVQVLALQAFLAVCFYVSVPLAIQAARARELKAALGGALTEARDAESRYRLIADRAHDIIVRADLTARIVYISPACRALGYEPEDLIGTSGIELVHPDDRERYVDNTSQLVRDGVADQLRDRQHRFRCKDGTYVWLEGNPTVLTDDEGKPVELLNVFRNINDRKAAETELAGKQAELAILTDHAPDLLVRIDTDDRIVYASPAARQFGYEPADLVGRRRADLVHPEDLERLFRRLAKRMAGDEIEAADRQYRIRRGDGEWIWVEGSLSLVRDAAGAVVGAVSLVRDVSERRAAAEALAESETRYRTLAENVSDILVRFGPDGLVRYISASCRAIGVDPEKAVGQSILKIVAPEHAAHSEAIVAGLFSGAEVDASVRRVHRVITPDGAEVWLEGSPKLVRDEAGKVVEVVTVLRDVSVRQQMEAALRRAQEEAEAAAQVKSEFLANMSHELRTPLTSVLGFTKLALEQPELAPLTRTYVERVSDASRALLSAVNDILDFSKLEAGQVTFQTQAVALAGLTRSALHLFQPQAGAKDLQLIFDCDLADDHAAMLDPDRMRQVLLNLIGNAVKFTETGSVTLSVAYDDGAQALHVAVRDTGAGIPADRIDRLFKRFSQVDGSLTRTGGTGLGLAICKGIVEAMGGEIGVTSEVGQGSCFAFTVPAPRTQAVTSAPAGPSQDQVAFGGVRVLIVDDHPANRELVGLILAGVGAEVTEAEDGVAAAELAAQWPYDVILMDVRMPRLDGPGALARIRSEPGPNGATPILAFTADADAESGAQLLAAGFQGLVAKPVSPPDLVAAVAQASAFADEELVLEGHAGWHDPGGRG
ncbi:PAS domain S-box protein [Phenylobacterium sp.]|uniref:PAS domain S-box protein n=1 Tax=Phenylobacterium sp. TaxID=1871053 RepID=UPI002ED91AB6